MAQTLCHTNCENACLGWAICCSCGGIAWSIRVFLLYCWRGLPRIGYQHRQPCLQPYLLLLAYHTPSSTCGPLLVSSSGYSLARCSQPRCWITIALRTVVLCRS